MREIKFRAWDVINKRMYPIAFPSWNGAIVGKRSNKSVTAETIDEDGDNKPILMQFTGLKDKDGVEIFEGDIVAYKTFFYGKERDHKKVVKWEKWVSDDFEQPDCVGYFNLSSEMEVIGNVYENPELLINKREEI